MIVYNGSATNASNKLILIGTGYKLTLHVITKTRDTNVFPNME
jgi:hypothetical protein